jgi:hypothetical protein
VSARTPLEAPERRIAAAARAAWRWWTRVAHRIGDVQARILLSVFYFVILGPFALVLRRRDPLAIRPGASRGWRLRETATRSVAEQARRQS